MAFVSFVRAMQKPKFLKAAKAAGLRGESDMADRVRREAQTNHTWAKYPTGAGADAIKAPHVNGNIKVDVNAAATAHLALS
jgi:hypothetical protein